MAKSKSAKGADLVEHLQPATDLLAAGLDYAITLAEVVILTIAFSAAAAVTTSWIWDGLALALLVATWLKVLSAPAMLVGALQDRLPKKAKWAQPAFNALLVIFFAAAVTLSAELTQAIPELLRFGLLD